MGGRSAEHGGDDVGGGRGEAGPRALARGRAGAVPERESRGGHGEQAASGVRRAEQVVREAFGGRGSAWFGVDERDDLVAVASRVIQAFEHEDDGRVGRVRGEAEFRGGGTVHGLVGEVDRADQRGIDLPGP